MGNEKGKSVEIRGFKNEDYRNTSLELTTNYCLQNQIATGLEAYYQVDSVESFVEKVQDMASSPRNLYLNYVLVDNGKEVFVNDAQRAKNFIRGIE